MDLCESLAAAGGHAGVVWILWQGGDLNANPVRFPAGGGVGEHVDGGRASSREPPSLLRRGQGGAAARARIHAAGPSDPVLRPQQLARFNAWR